MRFPSRYFLLVACAVATRADVTLAPPFSDRAVVQRDKPLPVWGRADPGEKVNVSFHDQSRSATTGADGRWIVFFDALPGSIQGSDLVVAGKNTITLRDVLVGEVWLCSGQSNMEFPVKQADHAATEISEGNFPFIRHLKIARTVAGTPAEHVVTGGWRAASPETVGDFTAVGYFFARDIFRKLNVPVGIVNSTWGGTPIEAWMSASALGSSPAFSAVGERWTKTLADYPALHTAFEAAFASWSAREAPAKAGDTATHQNFLRANPRPRPPRGSGDSWTPSGLFNGMINPLLPYAFRGALWYQGESNVNRAAEYHALFAAMITAWREHFGAASTLPAEDGANQAWPFYWVSLANFKSPGDPTGRSYAFLREAQTQTLGLPDTGQALTIDVGNPDDIHPTNKQEVGRRLALLAKNRVYGITGDDTGPTFVSAQREGTAMRVRFIHASAGLVAHDKPVQALELAGANGVFFPASAHIDRDSLIVTAPEVREPVAVRYAWKNSPEANLYNGAGLPAVPFRSDTW